MSIPNSSITISTMSYFATFNQFYSICSSSFSMPLFTQTMIPAVSLTSCNLTVGQSNTLTFPINVENVLPLDIITFQNYSGKLINKTGSLSVIYDKNSNSYSSLLTAI